MNERYINPNRINGLTEQVKKKESEIIPQGAINIKDYIELKPEQRQNILDMFNSLQITDSQKANSLSTDEFIRLINSLGEKYSAKPLEEELIHLIIQSRRSRQEYTGTKGNFIGASFFEKKRKEKSTNWKKTQ